MTSMIHKPSEDFYFGIFIEDPDTQEIIKLPKVTLLAPINSLTFEYKKLKQVMQTLGGYVEYHWGDALDTITAEGITVAFMQPQMGLTSTYREGTTGYEDLRVLIDLYKNNGNIYDEAGRVLVSGEVALAFDIGKYYGLFESFSYTEEEGSPFNIKLTFVFKVQRTQLSFNSREVNASTGTYADADLGFPSGNVTSLKELVTSQSDVKLTKDILKQWEITKEKWGEAKKKRNPLMVNLHLKE